MTFASPGWLWGLALVPVLYYLLVLEQRRKRTSFMRFADEAVWKTIAPEADWGARMRKGRVWILAFVFILLALARPQWGSHDEVVHASGLDVMIALDVSNSMDTEDVVPNRLEKAKHVIRTLTERLAGDRIGLLPFAASAFVVCPLTTDTDYLLDSLQTVGPQSVSNQGTDIGLALDIANKALNRGAEEAEKTPGAPPTRVIILLTDGEDHEGQALPSARALKDAGTKLYVLGIGTEKGGPIPIRDENGTLVGYKKDSDGHGVVSQFHPDTLVQLAQAAGGRYWNVTPSEAEADALVNDMGGLTRGEYAERRITIHEDRFQFPLAIAILLLMLELSLPARRILTQESGTDTPPPPLAKRGPEPKRGETEASALLGLAFVLASTSLLGPREARAASILQRQAPVDVYLNNRKGLKAFHDGKIDEAKSDFGAAQAQDPTRPELEFNQGVVQMQENDPDDAIRGFSGAADGALKRQDYGLAGKSFFNLGAALTKKGDVPGAIQSYLNAIQSAQAAKDSQLEGDARKNIELLIRNQQQQKQQQQQQNQDQKQKQDQQQQNQDQKQKQDQNKDKNQQDQKNQDQKNDQDQKQQSQDGQKQYQQTNKDQQKFRSLKLSKEDADRVMSELFSREKQLQARRQKQNGMAQRQQKDW